MWDEEINKKIKDSADQYHPAYDDTAWDKMERLLDEHLPAKKDRRRIIIYFLPLVLLLGGGIFFLFFHHKSIPVAKIPEKTVLTNNDEKSTGKTPAVSSSQALKIPFKFSKKRAGYVKKGNVPLIKTPSLNSTASRKGKIEKRFPPGNAGVAENRNRKLRSESIPNIQLKEAEDNPLSIDANNKNNSGITSSAGEAKSQIADRGNAIIPTAPEGGNNPLKKVNTGMTKNESEVIESKDKDNDVAKAGNTSEIKNVKSNVKQGKSKKSFLQNWGIGLGAGPDVSAVKLSNTGKITISYGAGLHYSFTKRFTLRTGFYVSRKIYSVDEDEYYVRPGSTWNNFLESVNANCKVYEVPVTLSYNFGKIKNHSWFASAGLSSYFMKKESYVYFYKNPLGITYNRTWSVTNQNKHYFSVVDISAGYQYSIGKRFSIISEHYVKLPLSGIGAGKIKLNSAGILFTAAVKPF